MTEIWEDIKGYEGLYQISNLGKIKSLDHVVKTSNKYKATGSRMVKGKMLKCSFDKDGYLTISLSKNNIVKTKRIHKLVAETFIINLHNLPIINHKDENKQNNYVDNLEWCTHQYNTNYNNMPFKRAENRRKKVLQYDKNGNLIKKWNSMTEASKHYNISRSNISLCCLRKRKTAGGFIWKYFDELEKMRSLESGRK